MSENLKRGDLGSILASSSHCKGHSYKTTTYRSLKPENLHFQWITYYIKHFIYENPREP